MPPLLIVWVLLYSAPLGFGHILKAGPYLTCGQLVVQGVSIGSVCEDCRQGHFLLHSHHLQTQQVSVYGLATDRLRWHRQLVCGVSRYISENYILLQLASSWVLWEFCKRFAESNTDSQSEKKRRCSMLKGWRKTDVRTVSEILQDGIK